MYQPNEALAGFEIPSARETATPAAPPINGCPEEPGRECMIRYLYARRKNHAVKCAHCGIIAARISNYYKAKERKVGREKTAKEVAVKVAASKARVRKEKRQLTPEDKERRRQICIANLAKGEARRQEIMAETRLRREDKATAKERREQIAARKKAKRDAALQESTADAARREVKAEMQDVRDGHKNPSRVQGVVLLLEWCIAEGVDVLSVRDFTSRFNALKGTIHTRSGVMGRSLRRYGLRVRVEYNDYARHNTAYLYVDDAARLFVADEFVFHTHARGSIKR